VRPLVHLLFALAALSVARPAAAQDLSCDRGDREVRALRFTGNREYAAAALAATVATTPSSVAGLPVIGVRRCLDPVEFARDVQRLETLYRRRGFPDVTVDTTVTTVKPGVIEITFAIHEGDPMRITALALRGLDLNPEVRTAARDFPLAVGGVFDRGALEAGRDTLVRRLRKPPMSKCRWCRACGPSWGASRSRSTPVMTTDACLTRPCGGRWP
jgi:outer membrane protein insertion porin family